MPRLHAILPLLAAFAVGAAPACRSFEVVNAQHCHHADGDQTCAERYGAERPFCVGLNDGCATADEYGCAAELPPIECYSPCGHGSLFDDDASCIDGVADEETTDTGNGDGDGDGDGDEPEPGPVCGDGIVEGDEECDDGNDLDDDDCTNACTLPVCGDGVVQEHLGEACDDGNTLAGDECGATCLLPGTVIWSRTYDFDECTGVAVSLLPQSHRIAAVGVCESMGGRLIRVDADGELIHTRVVMDEPSSLSTTSFDWILVGGHNAGVPTMGEARMFDVFGLPSWTSDDETVTIRDVRLDSSGSSFIVGSAPNGGYMARYTVSHELDWEHTQANVGTYTAVTLNPHGDLWVLRTLPVQVDA
jgi:cysteine-rich repeat protein